MPDQEQLQDAATTATAARERLGTLVIQPLAPTDLLTVPKELGARQADPALGRRRWRKAAAGSNGLVPCMTAADRQFDIAELLAPRCGGEPIAWVPRIAASLEIGAEDSRSQPWTMLLVATEQTCTAQGPCRKHDGDTAPGARRLIDALRDERVQERWPQLRDVDFRLALLSDPFDLEVTIREILNAALDLVPRSAAATGRSTASSIIPAIGGGVAGPAHAALAVAGWLGMASGQPVNGRYFSGEAPRWNSAAGKPVPTVAETRMFVGGAGVDNVAIGDAVRRVCEEATERLDAAALLNLHRLLQRLGLEAEDAPQARAAERIHRWFQRRDYTQKPQGDWLGKEDGVAGELDAVFKVPSGATKREKAVAQEQRHQLGEQALLAEVEYAIYQAECGQSSPADDLVAVRGTLAAVRLWDRHKKEIKRSSLKPRLCQYNPLDNAGGREQAGQLRNLLVHPRVLQDPRSKALAGELQLPPLVGGDGDNRCCALRRFAAAGPPDIGTPVNAHGDHAVVVVPGPKFNEEARVALPECDRQRLGTALSMQATHVLFVEPPRDASREQQDTSWRELTCKWLRELGAELVEPGPRELAAQGGLAPDWDWTNALPRSVTILALGGPIGARTELLANVAANGRQVNMVSWRYPDRLETTALTATIGKLTADVARAITAREAAVLRRGAEVAPFASGDDVGAIRAYVLLDPAVLDRGRREKEYSPCAWRVAVAAAILIDRGLAELGLSPAKRTGDFNEGVRQLDLGCVALAGACWLRATSEPTGDIKAWCADTASQIVVDQETWAERCRPKPPSYRQLTFERAIRKACIRRRSGGLRAWEGLAGLQG
ncbi:MAG: hypothetical protein QM679_12200, partial [Patulibacter sp.]